MTMNFENLLREFMAGRMSTKQGNQKLDQMRKKAFFRGYSRKVNPKLIKPEDYAGADYAWFVFKKSLR